MPWGRLDDSLYDHPKLDEIPADHRLSAIGLWARSISWCNRFLTDGHVPRERIPKLDGTFELAHMLVAAGLFEQNGTGYVIHDFLEFNDSREKVLARRKYDADRKAESRANRRPVGRPAGTTSVDEGNVPTGVRSDSRTDKRPESHRARGRASARESRPGPTRPDPTESLSREDPARAADIAALRELGWKRVTKAQRDVLAEVADRHQRDGNDGSWFAAEAIRAAGTTDPLEAVLTADRLWQQSQRRRADAEEAAWQETKAADVPEWARRSA